MVQTDEPKVPQDAPLESRKKRFGWGTLTVVSLIVATGFFVLGTRSQEVFALLGNSQNKDAPGQLDFTSVQQVYEKLRTNFDGKVDAQKLVDGAKKGLVDAAGDPYTVYFTDEEAKQFESDLSGKFSGIGAELGKKNGGIVVIATLDDSPARKSGLLAGDVIVKVNDQETANWSIDKAVSVIRGEKGTTVKLAIIRGQDFKEFSIVRAEIVNPSVRYEVIDGIGYLRVSRFSDTDTITLSRQAAAEFAKQNVRGVVLDLRGNGGGYMTVARDLTSLWMKSRTVVVQERRGDVVEETLYSQGEAPLAGMPTVVLIDGGSASASEITAGALHDHKIAQLVGLKTFGKGSVQKLQEVDSGGQLKVTIAKWFTPNGKNISKEGIEPDVKVEISDADASAGRDPQKDKALEILKAR